MAVTCKTVATMRCDGVCPWKVTLPPGLGTHRDRDLSRSAELSSSFLAQFDFCLCRTPIDSRCCGTTAKNKATLWGIQPLMGGGSLEPGAYRKLPRGREN